jgi:hypothetical protein
VLAELALQYTIGTTYALLLAQLLGIAGLFTRTTGAMLAGFATSALKGAFIDALVALQKKLYSLTPAQLADGAGITGHLLKILLAHTAPLNTAGSRSCAASASLI